jgi:hypothetical protein
MLKLVNKLSDENSAQAMSRGDLSREVDLSNRFEFFEKKEKQIRVHRSLILVRLCQLLNFLAVDRSLENFLF